MARVTEGVTRYCHAVRRRVREERTVHYERVVVIMRDHRAAGMIGQVAVEDAVDERETTAQDG